MDKKGAFTEYNYYLHHTNSKLLQVPTALDAKSYSNTKHPWITPGQHQRNLLIPLIQSHHIHVRKDHVLAVATPPLPDPAPMHAAKHFPHSTTPTMSSLISA